MIYIVDAAVGALLSIYHHRSQQRRHCSPRSSRRRLLSFNAPRPLNVFATGLPSAVGLVWSGATLFVSLSTTFGGVKAVTNQGNTVTTFNVNNTALHNGGAIVADALGNVYVVDTYTHTVVVISKAGVASTLLAPASAGSFAPTSISLSASGALIVNDASGSSTMVTSGGSCATISPILHGLATDGTKTGCGSTLASGATCTQSCSIGYRVSSSPAGATCTGLAKFTPQVCVAQATISYTSPSASTIVSTSATAATSFTFAVAASILPPSGSGVTISVACSMVQSNYTAPSAVVKAKLTNTYTLASTTATFTSASLLTSSITVSVPSMPFGSTGLVTCKGWLLSGASSGLYVVSAGSASLTVATSSTSIPAQPSCASFAIAAHVAITLAANVIIAGRVAVSPGTAITGLATMIDGPSTPLTSTVAVATCLAEVAAASAIASLVPCRAIPSGALGGLILGSGVYCAPTLTLAPDAVLTLDAAGDVNALFVIQATGSTLWVGPLASVRLVNGAKASNVAWFVATSATILEFSTLVGSIYSSVAVTFSANVLFYGRVFAGTSITLGTNDRLDLSQLTTSEPSALPSSSSAIAPYAAFSPCLAFNTSASSGPCLSSFSLLANVAVTFGSVNKLGGNVGVAVGSAITGVAATTSAVNKLVLRGNLRTAQAEASRIYATLAAQSCKTLASSELGGLTLGPGVYCAPNESFTLSSKLTLAGNGVAGAQFVFHAPGTFWTAAAASMKLTGTAAASDVFVTVGHALTIGASNTLAGTYLVGVSATVGASTTITGRIVANVALTLGAQITMAAP